MLLWYSNEENHPTVYLQGALNTTVHLTKTEDDVCRKYSAMALRFMATNPQVRGLLVADNRVEPFISLASEEYLDYKRTAAVAFASFSLNEENRPKVRTHAAETHTQGVESCDRPAVTV